ncbi:hypothetical protein ABIA38_007581 [Embleya sp. AB8]
MKIHNNSTAALIAGSLLPGGVAPATPAGADVGPSPAPPPGGDGLRR